MCSNDASPPRLTPVAPSAVLPYHQFAAINNNKQSPEGAAGQVPPPPAPGSPPRPPATVATVSAATLAEHYRLQQLYNYALAERLRYATHPAALLGAATPYPAGPLQAAAAAAAVAAAGLRPHELYAAYGKLDPRLYRSPEEPKPQHSYIGLIAMAILSSSDKKLVLSDIYQYILDNYAYFRSRGPGWRNSIRHNLSLNDCFIKSGRSANGKGHYWAIHPANIEDFKKGDFRRRKAQRKVRKHMGLAVDEEDSPSPPPAPSPPPHGWGHPGLPCGSAPLGPLGHAPTALALHQGLAASCSMTISTPPRKRQFDVASLLAPDGPSGEKRVRVYSEEEVEEEDIDVGSEAPMIPRGPSGPCWPLAVAPAGLFPCSMEQLSRYYEHLASNVRRSREALGVLTQSPPSPPVSPLHHQDSHTD